MRNSMTMYPLKPIISLPQTLHHRKTMYEMRNIHEERSTDDHTQAESKIVPDITEQSPLPEYNALEVRQEKILAQLAELKKQVSTLSNFLKQTNHAAIIDNSPKSQESVNVNFIINVNPRRPPYSIIALQSIWRETDIKVQTYVHSSVSKAGSIKYHSTANSTVKNVVNVSLIWKNVQDLELVSGSHDLHIIGETNFLRYISRLLNSTNYENCTSIETVNRIDLILDLCHSIQFVDSQKKKEHILALIADILVTNSSGTKEPNIGEIAVWSTIKQFLPNKYPPNLNQWFDSCEKLFV